METEGREIRLLNNEIGAQAERCDMLWPGRALRDVGNPTP